MYIIGWLKPHLMQRAIWNRFGISNCFCMIFNMFSLFGCQRSHRRLRCHGHSRCRDVEATHYEHEMGMVNGNSLIWAPAHKSQLGWCQCWNLINAMLCTRWTYHSWGSEHELKCERLQHFYHSIAIGECDDNGSCTISFLCIISKYLIAFI